MNAAAVFEERKDEFLALIAAAPDAPSRLDAAKTVMEQIACVLAQEEQDDALRQQQQAVFAALKRAPGVLSCAGAQGELVLAPERKKKPVGKGKWTLKAAGAGILALLAAVELIDGRLLFALLQLCGGALVLFGSGALSLPALGSMQARGIATVDAKALLGKIGDLCRAADVCCADLALLEREAGLMRLSGTADEATIDLLCAMLEAKASGRADAGERVMNLAEQYLCMLGMEAVYFSADTAAYFDVLPTLSGERTIRPAIVKDGKLLRRGVAAKAAERSVGA